MYLTFLITVWTKVGLASAAVGEKRKASEKVDISLASLMKVTTSPSEERMILAWS